jgi:hypothetical protein
MLLGAGMTSATARPYRITGSTPHRVYSVVVFIVLASLDNVAIGLVPPLVSPIGRDLSVAESGIGVVTAVSFLVTALAGVAWAYRGDRANRKPLLMVGTLLWVAGLVATAGSTSWPAFFGAQMLASLGLGAVGAVGAHEIAGSLSHGDKRKLELAILLATDPRVILLDEPMAGLGAADVPALTDVIRSLDRTILMVEHHMHVLLDLADRVAVMHHGALLAIDTPEKIMADPTVRDAYLGEPL